MTDHYCKTIRIDFDLSSTMLSDLPSPEGLADAIHEGLPKEWFNGEGEFTLGDLRWGHFENGEIDREKDARIIELEAEAKILRGAMKDNQRRIDNLEERNGEKVKVISDQVDVIGTMTDSINEKRHEIAGLEAALHLAQEGKAKTVGITESEVEVVRQAVLGQVNRIGGAKIEDADGVLTDAYYVIEAAIDTLPVMEERDLGWGDDDQLSILEAHVESIKEDVTVLTDMFNEIRTDR